MGILPNSKQEKINSSAAKRRSTQFDFGNINKLSNTGTVGFSAFRDNDTSAKRSKSKKKSNGNVGMMEDSDDDDDDDNGVKMEEVDDKDDPNKTLSTEDAKFQGELADGVGRIKVRL